MKSFICETDNGDMILTIKYNPEYKNFKLYLHGILCEQNGIKFYQDGASCPVKADRTAILQAADRLVRYHHFWTEESQLAFEKWFDKLWKQSHPESDGEPVFMEDTPMIFSDVTSKNESSTDDWLFEPTNGFSRGW